MPGLVPGIHVLLGTNERRGWPGMRAFTPVFDGLCPAMTGLGSNSMSDDVHEIYAIK